MLVIISSSCSNEDENKLIGDWDLKSIETTCEQGSLNEEIEIFESNGMCCITVSTIEMNDFVELTYTDTSCSRISFKSENELEIITDNNSSRDTSILMYEIIDESIEVCSLDNQCINYTISNNEIMLSLDITTRTGLTCARNFIYRR